MRKKKKQYIKKIARLIFFGSLLGGLAIIGLFAVFAKDLPDPAKISERKITQSTKIYDRTGEIILYDIHGEEKRTIIPFEDIPEYIKGATVAIEDDNFYHHIGFDWKGILRAAWANLRGKRIVQGGSTISQQYIKNAFLGGPRSERTFTRKIKELILSLELERRYEKDEIFSFYLNQVPYGSNAYGIEAAARTFFNKPAKELTLAQSALLASLPQAPSYYSPYGSHPDELEARKNLVLNKMALFGYISQEQADQAKLEELKYSSQGDLKAHHFITMIKEYLEENYSERYGDINAAGLKVYTTLDWTLQEIAEEEIAKQVDYNEKTYRAKNAALVAVDPKSGQLLALVGSKKYSEDQFNVATSPNRQPGSSFKPLVYALAFEKGYRPETIVFDLSTNFSPPGPYQKDYIPTNYDMGYRGPITLKSALAQSINIPAVKTLYLAGVDEAINLAQDMGITTLKDRSRYGLSLVLGGGEVKLIDETAAYGVFAAEGIKRPLTFILKIKDAQGRVLEEYEDDPTKVLNPETARKISDILSDDDARAPMFGRHSRLYIPGIPVAVKTGTTQDYSDGWTVGYTPSLSVGVWAGNNDYRDKMRIGTAGVSVAGPIWHNFIKRAYQIKSIGSELGNGQKYKPKKENEFALPKNTEYFTPPEKIATSTKPMIGGQITYQNKVKIDSVSGKLATGLTPPDLIIEKSYQQAHSILYYINRNDPLGPFPKNPENDEQFLRWEEPVLKWAEQQPCTEKSCYNQSPPTEYDDIHTEENKIKIEITSPKKNQLIKEYTLTITTQIEANLPISQVDFFFNNKFVGSDNSFPYSTTFNLGPYLLPQNKQTIKVRAYDEVLNRDEDEIIIKTNF